MIDDEKCPYEEKCEYQNNCNFIDCLLCDFYWEFYDKTKNDMEDK